ncbi:MAG: methyltransferase domain-containing protein [Anaerolineales bacterium]|nr:methyltransferase domain-containing protein [Anaerolineales bacterium]
MSADQPATADSYDRIAADYVRHIYHELEGKPFDRATLDSFAARLRGRGTVCDMGCGPGHVARYLAGRGLEVVGVDLSPGMMAQAAVLNPDIPFRVGDMSALDEPDGSWAGIAAFYSIIHIPRESVVATLGEMHRVLEPGGLLLMAFHVGDEKVHVEEMWQQPVALDFWFYGAAEMAGYLERAGFVVEEVVQRDPYAPDVEHQSRRAYLLARKPENGYDKDETD